MILKRIIAIIVAIGSIATACAKFQENYSIEIHLVPIWGVNEDLPERLTR